MTTETTGLRRPRGREAAPTVVQPVAQKKIVARMREHYTAVQELHAQGMSKAAIGRKLGLHQATVRKFFTARSLDDLIANARPGRPVPTATRPRPRGLTTAVRGSALVLPNLPQRSADLPGRPPQGHIPNLATVVDRR